MLLNTLLIFAILIAVLLIVASLRPSDFRVERSLTIAAPSDELFSEINDLRKAHTWSPWIELDRNAKIAFAGPAVGVGASSTWSGNNRLGEGRQTIVESRPNELVRIKLDFKRPFESTATAEFALKPQGDQTLVSWALLGRHNLFFKTMCLFLNHDKMCGVHFERGLANLKSLAESAVRR